MNEPNSIPPRSNPLRWLIPCGLLMGAAVAIAGLWFMNRGETLARGDDPTPTVETVGGVPMFNNWPKQRKPDVTLVLSGQTYGYLSPCGCSRPQKGGLERRANLVNRLQAKGWNVVSLDLGDVMPDEGLHAQNLLKYRTTMEALASMSYAGISLGKNDFAAQLFELLAEYTLNKPNQPPFILAANLLGVQRDDNNNITRVFQREEYFPGGPDTKAMVEDATIIQNAGQPTIAVVGVIGPKVWTDIEKKDPQFGFAKNKAVLDQIETSLAKHPANPAIRVLLYQGNLDEAVEVAKAYPNYQAILCLSEESEPPQFPKMMNDGQTSIIQVGHKGQNVGVLGFFAKPDGGFEQHYQLVPLVEEYLTPKGAEANHKVLQLLEKYAMQVKEKDMLAKAVANQVPHPAQIHNPAAKLHYAGSESCQTCHPNEYAIWFKSKHGHAYQALSKLAERPSNRQYDPECIVCHTVGFEFETGYRNAVETPQLKNVGCENCHGPGSGHNAQPSNPLFLKLMAPYKNQPNDALPPLETIKKLAETKLLERSKISVQPNEQRMVNAISAACMKCHDGENDPKFDFYEYFPKINHSGFKAVAPPK